jgi:hypothetical protein
MNAGATRNGRSPRDSTEVYAFWRAAALILLFNVLLVAWMLLKPGGDRVAAVVLNAAGFVGPLLVLPLCFGGLLRPMWRREASRTDNEPTVITGQRWAPVLLAMGIICWIFAQILFTYYNLVLHQAPPFPSLAGGRHHPPHVTTLGGPNLNFSELRKAEVGLPRIHLPHTPVNRTKKKDRDYSMPQPLCMSYRKWQDTLISYCSKLATPAHRDTTRCQSP